MKFVSIANNECIYYNEKIKRGLIEKECSIIKVMPNCENCIYFVSVENTEKIASIQKDKSILDSYNKKKTKKVEVLK